MPKPAFTKVYYDSLSRLYDPVERPTGVVNLSVAENRLAAPLLAKRLEAAGSGVSAASLAYNPYPGSDRLRAAVARVISRKIAGRSMDPNSIVLANGAGSALWSLTSTLADVGQGVMVPTPYYYAYDRDFTAFADCEVVPVDGLDGRHPLDPESMTAAYDAATARGVKCRILALTNPSNPTGEVLGAERVRAAIDWAADRGIEVIANELYACSVVKGGFESVLSLYPERPDARPLPPHVHFVWGLSKDFAANGLRCACVLSGAEAVAETMTKFAYFFQVGGTVQAQLAECLEDDAWVDGFLDESREQLRAAIGATEGALRAAGAPFDSPSGAIFVWADLRRWAAAASGELALFRHLCALEGGGVLICPGSAFHAPEGFFRICVTAAPVGHLEVGLERLLAGLAKLPAA